MSDTAKKGTVRVTQTGSPIGRKPGQRETLVGLGLNKIRANARVGRHAIGARHDTQGGSPAARRRERLI